MLERFETWLAERRDFGPVILRVILGVVFIAHGYAAAFVYTPAGVGQMFSAIGIPFPALNAWALVLIHLLGGAMILAGLFTRLNGLLHAFVMTVAAVAAHGSQGFFQSAIILDAANNTAIVGGYEYALVLALASLSLLFSGGGGWALDNVLGRALGYRTGATAGA
jgi:putative oxidoreductase